MSRNTLTMMEDISKEGHQMNVIKIASTELTLDYKFSGEDVIMRMNMVPVIN